MQDRAKLLLASLDTLTFDTYIDIVENMMCIDMFNVEDTLVNQAALYAYYGGLESQAKLYEDNASSKLEDFVSKTHTEYKELTSGSARKSTAKDIEAYVFSQPEYRDLKEDLREMSFKKSLLSKLLRALEHRKDMAVQIASKARKEMDLTR